MSSSIDVESNPNLGANQTKLGDFLSASDKPEGPFSSNFVKNLSGKIPFSP